MRSHLVSRIKSELLESLKTVRKSGTFGRNLFVSSAGSSMAYLLGFILSPVLARIYQPEAYGLYALFNTFIASISIISTLDYLNAFILPKSTRKFISLFQLSWILMVSMVLFLAISIYLFKVEILEFFNARSLGDLIYFVPVIVLLTGINRSLDLWNVRAKEFIQGAKAKVVGVVGAKFLTIIYGVLSQGSPLGFVMGDLLAKPITTFSLLGKSIRKNSPELLNISISQICAVAKEYKNYPIYHLPANSLIALSTQLPVYLLVLHFDSATVGHFSLASSLINAPTQIIGVAFAQVFFQKASETFHANPILLGTITKRFFKRLIYVAVLPFSTIVVFGDLIFTAVFGSNWELAGTFASYLSIMAYMNFISASISTLFRVMRHEKLKFYLILSGAFFLVAGLLVSLTFNISDYLVIVYSGCCTLLQFTLVAVVLHRIKLDSMKLLTESIVILILGILFMYSVRLILPVIF